MNSYSILLVNDRMEQLQREAAERHARPTDGAAFRRITAALTSLWLAIALPAPTANRIVPTLDGYPYRG
jgi:hypothetical protein